MSTCSSCGAPLLWTVHHVTGRRMPMDAGPVPADTPGAFAVLQGKAYPKKAAVGGDWHISHFATCPDSDRHRRSR